MRVPEVTANSIVEWKQESYKTYEKDGTIKSFSYRKMKLGPEVGKTSLHFVVDAIIPNVIKKEYEDEYMVMGIPRGQFMAFQNIQDVDYSLFRPIGDHYWTFILKKKSSFKGMYMKTPSREMVKVDINEIMNNTNSDTESLVCRAIVGAMIKTNEKALNRLHIFPKKLYVTDVTDVVPKFF